MGLVLIRSRTGIVLCSFTAALMFCVLSSCHTLRSGVLNQSSQKKEPVLEAMGASWGPNLAFEKDFLESFGARNSIKTQFVPNSRLGTYQELLRNHSAEPDLIELDVVWPSILADDLVDLSPYVKDQSAFVPQLLESYRVHGKLVALPVYVDIGVLYYRPELLEKYGFKKPPETWNELEQMARRIQAGERQAGHQDFWGYVWQGPPAEAGTCNELEWQSSAGAGNFIEPSGQIHVRSPLFAAALRRSTRWIGTISPPAEYVYHEDDSVNVWDAGQAAFMRNWASGYGLFAAQPGKDKQHFAVAPMPAGPGGHRGTLGGMGIAVSRHAAHRDLAIKALLELTNEANTMKRLVAAEGIPTRVALLQSPEVKSRSLLLAVAADLMTTIALRPALMAGDKYETASLAYAKAVNSVLRRQQTPEAAMAGLEAELMHITGLPAAH